MGMLDDILKSIQDAGMRASPPGRAGRAVGARRAVTPSMPAGRCCRAPPDGGQGHGMSTMAKVLLALLAMYAVKNVQRAPGRGSTADVRRPPGGDRPLRAGSSGGGLGDLLKGPLGGLIAGLGGGALLNGGLDKLLKQLKDSGLAAPPTPGSAPDRTSRSPRATSPRRSAPTRSTSSPSDTGMRRDDVLAGLSRYLPRFIDQLTPDGRLPTDQEWQRML